VSTRATQSGVLLLALACVPAWGEPPPRPPVLVPATPPERFAAALKALAPQPAQPLAEFPRSRRVRTAHFDVSTTHEQADLQTFVQTAEKVRVVFRELLGVPEPTMPIPTAFVWSREYLAWVDTLRRPEADAQFLRGLDWGYDAKRLAVVRYEPYETKDGQPNLAGRKRNLTLELDGAAKVFAIDAVDAAYPRLPPWLREGVLFLVMSEVNGTTMTHAGVPRTYAAGVTPPKSKHRTYVEVKVGDASGAGVLFNPRFVTEEVGAKRDQDVRLLMGLPYGSFHAEDEAKAFWFVRWLVEARDPKRARLCAWLAAISRGDDAETALGVAFEITGPRAYEEADRLFREEHAKRHPLPAPDASKRRELAGSWDPVLMPGHWQSYRLEMNAKGTFVETLRPKGGEPQVTSGTWEVLDGEVLFEVQKSTWKDIPTVGTITSPRLMNLRGIGMKRK
jgi:hypothetical protein